MKINELLMNIRNNEFNLERGLEVKKYLPMELKKTIAQGIIYDCTIEENGTIKVDSVERYMSYVRYMISMHTNLEYTDDDYDVLCSTEYEDSNLLNAIMDLFESDAKECSRILNLMMDDRMQEYSMEIVIAKFLHNLGANIGAFASAVNSKIDSFDIGSMLPDGADKEKLGDFLKNYVN